MQKDIFKKSEGDAWFERNAGHTKEVDKVTSKAIALKPKSVLEIGCSDGWRLSMIKNATGAKCMGIDPSSKAIEHGKSKYTDITLATGTADDFSVEKFDLIIFGFCLYLCDRQDLFQIATNCDNMLNDNGNIIIQDFKTPYAYCNQYSHYTGIKSYKMDYSKLFTWNPAYTLVNSEIIPHSDNDFSIDNRVGIDIIHKDTKAWG